MTEPSRIAEIVADHIDWPEHNAICDDLVASITERRAADVMTAVAALVCRIALDSPEPENVLEAIGLISGEMLDVQLAKRNAH